MMRPARHSPLVEVLARHAPGWVDLNGMRVAQRVGADDAGCAALCGIADVSHLRRFGCKGPAAPTWLAQQGVPVPAQPNQWLPLPTGGLVARLGQTEFLIEDDQSGTRVELLLAAAVAPRVYPVPRHDAALLLTGSAVNELFLQTCSFDFGSLAPGAGDVVLTSMVGVGVTLLAVPSGADVSWRLWCDGTYGAYLWETLCAIAEELGGGPIGLETPTPALAALRG